MFTKSKIFGGVIFLITASLLLISCSAEAEKVKIEEDIIGTEAICPVLGNEFTITESTPVVEYKGEKYYFCCPGCDTEFMKNPEKYIKDTKEESKSIDQGQPTKEVLYWTCSMHPEVRSDKEGNCPICGMDLIPVHEHESSESGSFLYLDKSDIALAGIRMVPARFHHIYKEIQTVGKVAYDPELVIAQEEYLNVLEMVGTLDGSDSIAMARAEEVVRKTEYKLRLLGMDNSEIRTLDATRKIETSLIIPENETWIYADVYESDIGWIKKGQDVMLTSFAYPGEQFQGKIKSINPTLNAKTRSIQVRIRLSNPHMKLKPGMYVDARIRAQYIPPTTAHHEHKFLAIPRESVLDTGNRRVVWVYLGDGNFQPREVKLGPVSVIYEDNQGARYYPVLQGLEENELVVTNGNFLIDSESQLTGIAAIGYGGALGVEEKPAAPVHQH